MPAKRKITINRKKKEEEVIETPVETVIEEEIKVEEVVEPKKSRLEAWIVWNGQITSVRKPIQTIRFEAKVAPVPMFKLPPELRQYLVNKWFGTSVWKKDKEWLEKHWADMEMIEKLKKFLSGLDY